MNETRWKPLALLAVVGLALFALSFIWSPSSDNNAMDEEVGVPAVSKEQARVAADRFVAERFGQATWQDVSVVYDSNKPLSGYLQKNKLTAAYRTSYGNRYPLDYWQVTGRDPATGTQITVRIGMDQADVVGWEAKPRRLAPPAANGRGIAEAELTKAGYNVADFAYVGTKQGNPRLYVFESARQQVGEAKLELNVEVSGTTAVSFDPAFRVPDSYTDWLNKQKLWASIMSFGFLFGWFALGVTALVYTILYGKQISFRRGLVLIAVFAATNVLQIYNGLPGLLTESDGGNSGVFSAIYLAFSLAIMVLMSASLYICLLSGDALWRRRGWNQWPRWREPDYGKHVLSSVAKGYLICFFVMGIQQLVFWIAERSFDSFSINDPSQSVLNAKWPALYPLLAWMAAISEEILFRLFGIIIFKKLLRFNFLAVLVPSVIWAMGHTSYAVYPSYTRLIEVTVIGIIWGYAFLKFGLITVIFSHAIMDSILTALSLASEFGTFPYIALAVAYAALPAAIGYAIAALHRSFGRGRPATHG